MKKTSKTDWARIKSMKDRDIDYSDIPELKDDCPGVCVAGKEKADYYPAGTPLPDFFSRKASGSPKPAAIPYFTVPEVHRRHLNECRMTVT